MIFGAWGVVDCADLSSNPAAINEACSSSSTDLCTAGQAAAGQVKSKRGLTNRLVWKWANGSFVAFDVADHRAFFDWGFNLATRNIRWINKSGMGRCLTPVGSCSITYGVWRTEVCDRSGADTCLFRRESGATVSFTYGVAFNRHLISCVGTRINWDGSHTRNTWGGDCTGAASTATAARFGAGTLTAGSGKNALDVGRYLGRGQLGRLDRACLSVAASGAKCRKVALALYRSLPDRIQRKLAGQS